MTEFPTFSHVLFYGREYEEVLSMVALTEKDLAGKKVLDCPSGPDAFVAEAVKRGFNVMGCDPLYVKSHREIVESGMSDITLAIEETRKRTPVFGDIDMEAFTARKFRALDRFTEDFEAGREMGRYVPAALPSLPFEDRTFDLVISANLLFTYSSPAMGGISSSDKLNLDFHRESVHELIRVCRGELRLYPVMMHGKNRLHPYVAQIIGQLAADGVAMTFIQSTYEQSSFTGSLVLVIDCAEPAKVERN